MAASEREDILHRSVVRRKRSSRRGRRGSKGIKALEAEGEYSATMSQKV
jgi:hypothetical protein